MIVFNECKIDRNRGKLVINASVEDLPCFESVLIKEVIVDSEETFVSDSAHSKNPLYRVEVLPPVKPPSTEGNSISPMLDLGPVVPGIVSSGKEIKLELDSTDLKGNSLSDHMFFVYIRVEGDPLPDTPCGKDKEYSIAVAVDMRPAYDKAMGYIRELENDCTIPKGFIDMILRLKAFDLSIRTGNFKTAIKQWKKFHAIEYVSPVKGCCCNGIP